MLARTFNGIMRRKKNTDNKTKPLAVRATTPWFHAKIANSYSLVTRSHRAVVYPAMKIPSVRTEKGCIQNCRTSVLRAIRRCYRESPSRKYADRRRILGSETPRHSAHYLARDSLKLRLEKQTNRRLPFTTCRIWSLEVECSRCEALLPTALA